MKFNKLAINVFMVFLALTLVLSACSSAADTGDPPPASTSNIEVAAAPAVDTSAGQKLFTQTCVACHGPDATGVPGLGPNLHRNAFISGIDDTALVTFLEEGRPVDAPENKTGVAMPPKGGNPGLTAANLTDIAVYLRSLQ